MDELLEKIFIGIIIAVTSSWFTVHLALAKFRTEKWWERKIKAYTKVIVALHHSKAVSDKYIDAIMQNHKLPEKTLEELWELDLKARKEIDKYTDIGSFLFSEEFFTKLKKYQGELDNLHQREFDNSNPACINPQYMFDEQALTKHYLDDLIVLAKNDLSTSNNKRRIQLLS